MLAFSSCEIGVIPAIRAEHRHVAEDILQHRRVKGLAAEGALRRGGTAKNRDLLGNALRILREQFPFYAALFHPHVGCVERIFQSFHAGNLLYFDETNKNRGWKAFALRPL